MVLVAIVGGAISGCASDYKLDPEATIMNVDTAKEARKYFDRYAGDYNSMSPEDKKSYLDLFKGDQSRADKTWEIMSSPPPGSGPTPSTGTQGGI